MIADPAIARLLIQRTVEGRVPVSVMLELTYRCNLRCRHCYLEGLPVSVEPDLSTAEVMGLLDQLAAMGTLYLSLSGGEPLLRRDIWDVLQGAADRGFALRLFTNATLLDEAGASRLGALGVVALDVSLHGAGPESHDWMTRRRGSFGRTMEAVERARAHGVRVTLKVPLTDRNASEREAMQDLAGRLGARILLDPVVSARNCGARDTLCLRLRGDDLVDLYRAEGPTTPPPGPAELTCTAGINTATVTPEGVVRPCVQLLLDCGRLRERRFSEIWETAPVLQRLRGLTDGDVRDCSECPRRFLCNRCPGLALLEDGDLLGPSSAACLLAEAREEAARNTRAGSPSPRASDE